jgi:hypothetical protein
LGKFPLISEMKPHNFYTRLTVSFQRSGLWVCGFCIIFFLSFCHLGKFPLISEMKSHNFYTRLTVSFQRSGLQVCGFCIIFFLSFCHLGKFPLISEMKPHNFYTRLTVSFQRSGLRVCERRRGVIFGVFYSSGGVWSSRRVILCFLGRCYGGGIRDYLDPEPVLGIWFQSVISFGPTTPSRR